MEHSLLFAAGQSQFIIRYEENQQCKLLKNQKKKAISASSQLQHMNHKRKLKPKSLAISAQVKLKPSLPTNPDQKKQQKEYSRIPIQYLEEKMYGSPVDRVKGRIVYRGYAPKNTYFYLKTILNIRNNHPHPYSPMSNPPTHRRYIPEQSQSQSPQFKNEDIVFSSKFQSGNLNAAIRVTQKQYWLYMREDTNTHGLRQWYYFTAKSKKNLKAKIRIYKFTKRFSLYKDGMKPFIKTHSQWKQQGQNVGYQYDEDQKCFYLHFQYTFQQNKQISFATLPPYTYSMLSAFLQSIEHKQHIHIKNIGYTLSGFDIPSITISSKHQKEKKEAIIVLARTHPGQTVSNFTVEAFIDRVLQFEDILLRYSFYIVPMVNPDGVILGNHRTGVLGQDLNRHFHSVDQQYFPEVETIEKFVINVQKKHKIAFLFDLHGHSAKKNIFAYGEQHQIGSQKYLYSRIIPKILQNSISSFRYDHCVFKASKQKKHTARVYLSKKNDINAITFQQSYGLIDAGRMNTSHWSNFGIALANAIIQYSTLDLPAIKTYLSDQMDKQQLAINKKQQRIAKRKQRQRKQTQGLIQSAPRNIIEDFLRFKKKETPSRLTQQGDMQLQIEQQDDEPESESESMDSGDEDMQLKDSQLQNLKKDIVRVNAKDTYQRMIYNMAEKRIDLQNSFFEDHSARLHQKHQSAIRLFRLKSRKKQERINQIHQNNIQNNLQFQQNAQSRRWQPTTFRQPKQIGIGYSFELPIIKK